MLLKKKLKKVFLKKNKKTNSYLKQKIFFLEKLFFVFFEILLGKNTFLKNKIKRNFGQKNFSPLAPKILAAN